MILFLFFGYNWAEVLVTFEGAILEGLLDDTIVIDHTQ